MSDQYRGCRVVSTLPFAFNDFGHRTGLLQNFTFTEIDTVIDGLNSGNAVVPNFPAIILAFSGQFEYDLVDRPLPVDDRKLGVVSLIPKMWPIPDVYAFLHAVFNSGYDTIGKPDSIINTLYRECKAVEKQRRTRIINTAAALQSAYVAAVSEGMWVSLQPKPKKKTPASVAIPAAAIAAGFGPPKTDIPLDVPRFFVFVHAAATNSIVLIDGEHIIPLARTTAESPPGVLCDKVTNCIKYLRDFAGPGIESCVFGLSSRGA